LAQARADPRHPQLGGILDSLYYHKQAAALASGQGLGDLPFHLSLAILPPAGRAGGQPAC
jgi:hypothetical protein